MGSVGNFLFGGSSQQQRGQNQSQQSSSSQNQSTQSSNQASANESVSNNLSGSNQYNQAYAPVSSAMTPVLSSTQAAGNMMSALLGLPTETKTAAPAPYVPPASPLPANAPTPTVGNLGSLITQLSGAIPKAPTPSPAPAPSASTGSAPPPVTATQYPTGNTYYSPSPVAGYTGPNGVSSSSPRYESQGGRIEQRAMGGPVNAGQPYVVGEHQPELFVPHTSGTIVPQVPGGMLGSLGGGQMTPGGGGTGFPISNTRFPVNPGATSTTTGTGITPTAAGGALQNFANSAGEQFILGQGQKAITGANAANGVFDSGATGQALVQYGQGLGSTYLNDYMTNLNNYAKLGLSAAGAMTGAGGVGTSQGADTSVSQGASMGTSTGQSSGSSTGFGASTGNSSGNGNSKNGLLPALGSVGF